MAIITVSNTSSLAAALKSAVGGDTIKLLPGTYSDLSFKQPAIFNNPVTITSADLKNPAVITDFTLNGWKGLTFSQIEMRALDRPDLIGAHDGSYVAFKFKQCSDIVVDRVRVYGSLDNNPGNDVSGISFSDGSKFTVVDSEFEQLKRAILVGRSENVKITGNNIHDMRSDGTNFVEVKKVEITNNTFSSFFPKDGDHPDAIQFLTKNALTASTDIKISNNVMIKGDGKYFQGIFFRDQQGNMPFERVNISDNFIAGTGYNGIRIQGANDIKLERNELVSFAGENTTFFLVQGGKGVIATGNTSANISFGDSVSVVQQGNMITKSVVDFGSAALQNHISAFGDRGGLLGSFLSEAVSKAKLAAPVGPQHVVGDWKDNALSGGQGADTLEGRGGNDTLTGGAGDDTYIVVGSSSQIVENTNGGMDTMIARGDHRLGTNVENLVISQEATNNWAGTGNELDNRIIGNAGSNRLEGLAGNDSIDGGAGNDVIRGGAGQDYCQGGEGNDLVLGDEGSDSLVGGLGADTLEGGAGADTLSGGLGADRFLFRATDLGTTDRVLDFSRIDGDKINLSAIDANLAVSGDQRFAFIGSNAFSKVAGELRAVVSNSNTTLMGDTNGDGVADFQLVVVGGGTMQAADFIL